MTTLYNHLRQRIGSEKQDCYYDQPDCGVLRPLKFICEKDMKEFADDAEENNFKITLEDSRGP